MPKLPIDVLLLTNPLPTILDALRETVNLLDGRDPAQCAALVASHRNSIRAIATNGHDGASRELIESLPKLELISSLSAGLDHIDVDAAAERGVIVTNTSNALFDDVADVAIALCLLLLRRFLQADRYVREGQWKNGPMPLAHSAKGKRLGILGMGTIGNAIARRAEAMGMTVAYTSRRERPDSPHMFHASLMALAEHSDILVVCAPATPETFHMVDAKVLQALGPQGYLVNIARGTVVDEPALVAALQAGVIAGAGLDVFEHEPKVPAELLTMDNVVLFPHVGSATHETRLAMGQMMIDAIVKHFGQAAG